MRGARADAISGIQRGESPAALANTIDGGTKATCLLCFCPSRPCSSVFLCAVLFFSFLCSLDNVIKHTHEATLHTHSNNTHNSVCILKGVTSSPRFLHLAVWWSPNKQPFYTICIVSQGVAVLLLCGSTVCVCMCVCSQAEICTTIYSEDAAEFGMK